ncbi:MAG: hypothetical protein JGK38_08515 [Microcoleus sp. PH2017_15_JOR_U_A]|uniref:Ig-like domain-containing protein n=1 Tax=Microcoleus sp. PH2017_15_JOR_U_A TaxID=2798826 RepID=UPI001D6F6FBB|nr:hypothetical protein [Microcoleus sp. PH2017_15_JOR_U_A]
MSIDVTNSLPIAIPDTYIVRHDRVLTGFPSVLFNDFDPDIFDTLTAAVVTQPTKGKLVLNPKGDSFTLPAPDLSELILSFIALATALRLSPLR